MSNFSSWGNHSQFGGVRLRLGHVCCFRISIWVILRPLIYKIVHFVGIPYLSGGFLPCEVVGRFSVVCQFWFTLPWLEGLQFGLTFLLTGSCLELWL